MIKTILKIIILILHLNTLSPDFCIGLVQHIATVKFNQIQNSRCCYKTLENDGMFCVLHAISNTKSDFSIRNNRLLWSMTVDFPPPTKNIMHWPNITYNSYYLIRESPNKNYMITLMQSLTADLSSTKTA